MKLIVLRCPGCGAAIDVPENGALVNCKFCGSSVSAGNASPSVEQQIENLMEIAYAAIKSRNFEEGVEYCNRVLELDSRNVKALWGKAVAKLNGSNGVNLQMNEGLNYAKKAFELGTTDEKVEIREKVISELCSHPLWVQHCDILFRVFDEFGKDDLRPLEKVIEICKTQLPDEDANEKIVQALELIRRIDLRRYEDLRKSL
jgi:hypothetical protein